VPLAKLIRAALLALVASALLAAAASAALVEVNGIALHADGGFEPRSLPRHRFVPINFQGYFEIHAKRGGRPPALEEAIIEFDRDGRLSVAGLATCPPERIANATTAQARKLCRRAQVGTGRIEAIVSLPGAELGVGAPLTLFNGPPVGGMPTAVLHAHFGGPVAQTYAITVPIERHRGLFRYQARIVLPPLLGGLGSVTDVSAKIGRRYSAGGKPRSYVSAHCSDNILQTRGHFLFSDGTVIDGAVEKYCHAK
jgi:hypothetical protein